MAIKYNDGKLEGLSLDHNWGNVDGQNQYAYTGEQVQAILVSELKDKVGYFYSVDKGITSNMLLGFANETTFNEWYAEWYNEESGIPDAAFEDARVACKTSVAKSIPEPYYSSTLENKYASDRYISVDGKILIPVRFTSTYNVYDATTGELVITNNSEQGDLLVQARQDNSVSWDSNSGITKQTYKLQSTNYNDKEGSQIVDLTNLLSNGSWEVRMMVTSTIGDKAESTWVYYSVIKTNIDVSLRTSWAAAQTNGKITLDFNYSGAFVDKYLNIEVTGAGSTTNSQETKKVTRPIGTQASGVLNIMLESQSGDTYNVGAHGIHTIKYWVDVEQNENYQTEPKTVQIMVATDKNNLNPYIIMNNINGDDPENALSNWTNQDIFTYAVYAPNELGSLHTDFPVKVSFRDATGKEYFNDMANINSKENQIHTINKDLAIETDGDVIAPRVYCESNWPNTDTQSNLLINKAFIQFYVDNKGDYAPSTGADFIFNPRTRSNDEPAAERVKIYNGATGLTIGDDDSGLVDESELVKWVGVNFNETDGWIQDADGRKCLRLLDGQQLTIPYQPFSYNIGGNINTSVNCYTVEMTVATRNIVDEEIPLIRICDSYRATENAEYDTINGFELRGVDAYFIPSKEKNRGTLDIHDIMFQEGVKTHIAVSICHMEKTQGETVSGMIKPTPTGSLVSTTLSKDYNFIRIYVNGVLNRIVEYTGSPMTDELQTPGAGSGTLKRYIVLGNEGVYDENGKKKAGADLDVYEMRVYKGTYAKDASEILKDYMASLSTIEEKKAIVEANDIIDETTKLISYSKASLKYNTLLWKPGSESKDNYVRPSGREFGDTEKGSNKYASGDLEVRLFKTVNGKQVLDEEKSGVLNDVKIEGQGTSAMTYYKWNQRYRFDKAKKTTTYFTPITGDKIKKGYALNDNDPVIARCDGKINWASSMHSHKMGATGLYNDCWKQIMSSGLTKLTSVSEFEKLDLAKMKSKMEFSTTNEAGETTTVKRTPTPQEAFDNACKFTGRSNGYGSCRVTVRQEPFLLFVQPEYKKDADGNDTDTLVDPIYYGTLTWGASKGDKPTFGYNKEFNPYFVMIEGTDNDRQLIMCAVPWDNTHVTQNFKAEEDGDAEKDWVVAGVGEGKAGNYYNGACQYEISMGKDTKEYIGAGWDGINPCLAMFKEMNNYAYLHNHRINVFKGTYDQLVATNVADLDTTAFYWVTQASNTTPAMAPTGTRSEVYDLYRYNSNDVDGAAAWVNAGLYDAETKTYAKLNLQVQTQLKNTELIGTEEENNEKFKSTRATRFREGYASLKNHPYGYDVEYPNGIGEYVHISDLQYTLQFLKLIAGTDNWGKNTYIYNTGIYYKQDPTTGKYYGGSEKFGGLDKFGFFQDDVDTIFEIDNSGQKNKPYYVEEHDIEKVTAGVVDYYWNSQTNALFNLTEMSYPNEMKSMMAKILTAMATLGNNPTECFDKYFQQKATGYLPATVFNQNAELLYIDGHLRGSIEGYDAKDTMHLFLSQCLGDQCQAEREWQKKRVDYISSYAHYGNFAPGTGGGGGIAMRSKGYAFHFELTPHIWLYPVVTHGSTDLYYNSGDANPTGTIGRVAAGKTIKISTGADSETQVRLKAMDLYSDIGNFARHTADTQFVLRGARISDFIVRGTVDEPILFNPSASFTIDATASVDNLRNFEISGRVANNSAIMNYNLDFSRLWRLENLDLTATSTTGVTLPDNSNIQSIKLPATVANLTLVEQTKLNKFELGGYANLRVVEISGTPFIDTLQFVKNCMNAGTKLNSLTLKDIKWEKVDLNIVNYILGISNVNITGRIDLDSTANVDFATKAALLAKFGNIDNETNALHIVYPNEGFNAFTAKIMGDTYISKNGRYQFTLSATGNDFISVDWMIGPNDYATIDNSGLLTYIDKPDSASAREIAVQCTISLKDGNDFTVSKTIYFREKVAEIGDYVYYDGTLSTPAEYNPAKTVIGVCYYVNGSDRRMMSVSLATPDRVVWGMSKNSFTLDAKYDPNILQITPTSLGLGGLNSSGSYTDLAVAKIENGTLSKNLTVEAYTQAGQIGGLKQFPMNTVVPCGQFNTLHIIDHRNENVIKQGLGSSTIPGRTSGGVYSLDEYTDLTNIISSSVSQNKPHIEASLYPAASYCYCFEPVVAEGEVLDSRFAKYNWYLPSQSELMYMWKCSSIEARDTEYRLNRCKALYDDGKWVEPVRSDTGTGTTYWSSNYNAGTTAYVCQFRSDKLRPNYYDCTSGTTNGLLASGTSINRWYVRACAKF